jgi:LEA14-like dessication related protein
MALTKKQKTGIWLGVGAVLLGTGIYLYSQVKRLMNYSISFNTMKIKTFNLNKVDLDLYLNFTNKSDLDIELVRQKYKLFINGAYITTIKNNSPNVLKPNSSNILSLAVVFDPRTLKERLPIPLFELITSFKKQKIRVDFTFYVKFGPFTLPIPYSFEGKPSQWK